MKDIISRRRSIRSFLDTPLEEEKISLLFEAARWSPSAMNSQPWLYVYARSGEDLHTRISDTLAPGNRIWAAKAPLLIVSLVKTDRDDGHINSTAEHDTGMANHAIALQCTDLGLQAHMMGGFDHAALGALLELPPNIKPLVVMAVGYPGIPDHLPEPLRERETAPRKRKPVNEFVFNHPHIKQQVYGNN